MLSVGYHHATTMVEMFADLPADHELFVQFSFIRSDELPDVQTLLNRANREKLGELKEEDRMVLLSLPFKLTPARHRLGLMDEEMQQRVLKARAAFADGLPEELQGTIEFFDADSYNAAANLQDNILFGKIAYGQAESASRVGELIAQVIDELGLRGPVAEAGLTYDVGIAGSESKILSALLEEFSERCLIWSLHRASLAHAFDQVLVMRGGRVVERGTYADLDKDGTYLKELLAAE